MKDPIEEADNQISQLKDRVADLEELLSAFALYETLTQNDLYSFLYYGPSPKEVNKILNK